MRQSWHGVKVRYLKVFSLRTGLLEQAQSAGKVCGQTAQHNTQKRTRLNKGLCNNYLEGGAVKRGGTPCELMA